MSQLSFQPGTNPRELSREDLTMLTYIRSKNNIPISTKPRKQIQLPPSHPHGDRTDHHQTPPNPPTNLTLSPASPERQAPPRQPDSASSTAARSCQEQHQPPFIQMRRDTSESWIGSVTGTAKTPRQGSCCRYSSLYRETSGSRTPILLAMRARFYLASWRVK